MGEFVYDPAAAAAGDVTVDDGPHDGPLSVPFRPDPVAAAVSREVAAVEERIAVIRLQIEEDQGFSDHEAVQAILAAAVDGLNRALDAALALSDEIKGA